MGARGTATIALASLILLLRVPGSPSEAQACHKRKSVASGYQVGVAWPAAHKNLAIYPIYAPETVRYPKLLTLEEALNQKKAVVHETDEVNELEIENVSEDESIYVQSGDIVKGGKQDRMIAFDLVLPPRSGKKPAPSFCVESGRWYKRQAEDDSRFLASPYQGVGLGLQLGVQFGGAFGEPPGSRASRPAAGNPPSGMNLGGMQFGGAQLGGGFQLGGAQLGGMQFGGGVPSGGQSTVWREVKSAQEKLSAKLGNPAASDYSPTSLQLTLENKQLRKLADPYLRELGPLMDGRENVVGFAYAINGKVIAADIYGSAALFHKLWPKRLQSCVIEAIAEEDEKAVFRHPKPHAVCEFFLEADRGEKGETVEFHERIRGFMREGRKVVLFETRDGLHRDAMLHRNYLRKE